MPAASDSILMETWLSLFGERRGMAVGRSWASRIFALAYAFFSVVVLAACELCHTSLAHQFLVLAQAGPRMQALQYFQSSA